MYEMISNNFDRRIFQQINLSLYYNLLSCQIVGSTSIYQPELILFSANLLHKEGNGWSISILICSNAAETLMQYCDLENRWQKILDLIVSS